MDMTPYLQPDFFLDFEHPEVVAYVQAHRGPSSDTIDCAKALYFAIRDGFRYNPWEVEPEPEAFRASAVARRSKARGGHCIDKAVLLVACCRSLGIPGRLHFANVRNHIGTQELQRLLGTDLLVFHGYAELYLDGRWVAVTPAFNRELCDHLGVAPLDFDGCTDSIFQEFDRGGGRFMEYMHDYGAFATIPYDMMVGAWDEHYSDIMAQGWREVMSKRRG